MGFLSRKSKRKQVTVEEAHPIADELQRMEEVVPEYEEPGPLDSAEEYGEEFEAHEEDRYFEPEAVQAPDPEPVHEPDPVREPEHEAAPVATVEVAERESEPAVEEEDDGRMKASDLLAPMRQDLVAPPAER